MLEEVQDEHTERKEQVLLQEFHSLNSSVVKYYHITNDKRRLLLCVCGVGNRKPYAASHVPTHHIFFFFWTNITRSSDSASSR